MRGYGPATQKILLLLLGGVTLGFSHSLGKQRRIWNILRKEWRAVDQKELIRTIQRLYESKLIKHHEHEDGTTSLTLSKEGKRIALRYHSETIKIPHPKVWDKKWRLVIFDIPEKKKRLRDTIRLCFRKLGFIELQKSVFVHPYECLNEIDFLIELYQARPYIRFIEAIHIDNELHLKKKFKLLYHLSI